MKQTNKIKPNFQGVQERGKGTLGLFAFLFNPGHCNLLLWLIKSWSVIEKRTPDGGTGDIKSSSYSAFN